MVAHLWAGGVGGRFGGALLGRGEGFGGALWDRGEGRQPTKIDEVTPNRVCEASPVLSTSVGINYARAVL